MAKSTGNGYKGGKRNNSCRKKGYRTTAQKKAR